MNELNQRFNWLEDDINSRFDELTGFVDRKQFESVWDPFIENKEVFLGYYRPDLDHLGRDARLCPVPEQQDLLQYDVRVLAADTLADCYREWSLYLWGYQ